MKGCTLEVTCAEELLQEANVPYQHVILIYSFTSVSYLIFNLIIIYIKKKKIPHLAERCFHLIKCHEEFS